MEQKIKILDGESVPVDYIDKRAIKIKKAMMKNISYTSHNIYTVGIENKEAVFNATEESKVEAIEREVQEKIAADVRKIMDEEKKVEEAQEEVVASYTPSPITKAEIRAEIDEEFVHKILNTTTNVFTLTATDSRGFSAEKTITLEDTGYTKPTISGKAERNTPTDGLVDISFDGSNFVKKIVNTDNELMVQYRKYQKGATNKGNWTNLTYTLNDNGTFTGKLDNVSGFDYQKEYVVELKCYDLLSESNIVTISITKGEPVFWWNSDNFRNNYF